MNHGRYRSLARIDYKRGLEASWSILDYQHA